VKKVVVELALEDIGAISAILDTHAPGHRVTQMMDNLYLACNNLPWEILSITDERAIADRIGKVGRL
jgi:hypothetical protein